MSRLAGCASRKALCACALREAVFKRPTRLRFRARQRIGRTFERGERCGSLRRVAETLKRVQASATVEAASGNESGAEFGAAGRHCLFLSVSGVDHREDNMQHD